MPFTVAVCKQLRDRVNGLCSRCRTYTSGPSKDPSKAVSIGEGAHICGEKPGAARHDPKLSPAEIGRADNGIWLCASCHTIVDGHEGTYTVLCLRQIKLDTETFVGLAMGVTPPSNDLLAAVEKIRAATETTAAFVYQWRVAEEGAPFAESAPGDGEAPLRQSTVVSADVDAKYVNERVEAFDARTRLAHLGGYLLGLSPDLLGRLTDEEFTDLFQSIAGLPNKIIATLLKASQRMLFDIARDFRESVLPTNTEITHLFSFTSNMDMAIRLTCLHHPGVTRRLHPLWAEWQQLSFRQQLENNHGQMWEPLQRCLAGYDPKRHPPGSDEEYRYRIATVAIDGAPSREEFERRLRAAIDTYLPQLEERRDKFVALLPTDLLVICDVRGTLENAEVIRRMSEAMTALGEVRRAVRGSPDK